MALDVGVVEVLDVFDDHTAHGFDQAVRVIVVHLHLHLPFPECRPLAHLDVHSR